jgi:predicted acylesterase/phospholipase RssA
VFVASGGVFRGAFHVGLAAAMRSCGIKPDLIVGASVGTLMGGALGAMFVPGQTDVLARLVDAFLRVDELVALTRTLKSAARELGIRGRSIRLSPRDLRRMVRRGSREDPGFAATGAPSALIDAMSDLFLIPHRETREIAAEFVAGHVTQAVHRFLGQLRTETIKRLDIEEAVLGASLLEDVAVGLLTGGSAERRLQRQPFQPHGIAYYGATTNLMTHSALLLGGNGAHRDAPFDFVEAVLASSAFPVVFAPRKASRVFPGSGRADVFYADGGMFDNLPFLPAIEILSRAQRGYRMTRGRHLTRLRFLEQRLANPDLVIAGALNALAEDEKGGDSPCDSLGAIRRRAGSLQHNVKIAGFRLAAQRVYGQLQRLRSAAPTSLQATSPGFVDDVVNAAVLPVFPTSAEHLNGTFAFCASTGLNRGRVQKSIADGCYQTLLSLAVEQQRAATRPEDVDTAPRLLAAKSVRALQGRIPALTRVPDPPGSRDACPYFRMDGRPFACPFTEPPAEKVPGRASMRGVFRACWDDPDHWDEARGLETKARGARISSE